MTRPAFRSRSMIPMAENPTRDFIGYGASPPDAAWPGGARVAVNFCINYEEGGELCILNGDDRSEVRVSDVAVKARHGQPRRARGGAQSACARGDGGRGVRSASPRLALDRLR